MLLGDVSKIKTGNLDVNAKVEIGRYPFFTCAQKPERINSYSFDCECVLVAGNGDLNIKYYKGKFDVYQRTYVVEVLQKDRLDTRFLFYFLNKYLVRLRSQSIGGVIKYIKMANLTDIELPEYSLKKQKQIIQILDTADNLRQKRKEQLALLDDYLKSVFLDMFGDPVKNCKQWRIVFFSKGIDSIKYGTSIPPEFSDFGYPFIRATNVKNGGIASDNMLFISEIEAKKIKKCKLILGDIIIVRSGANTGDNAVVNTEYEGAYAAYDIIIRMNNLFHPIFINGVLNSVYKEAVISPLTRRAGQPHLNTTQINNLPIYLPPFELQNKFADIVEQVEQIKQKMRVSLDEMDNHFNALMQRYFE